jgi:hypothetical protein
MKPLSLSPATLYVSLSIENMSVESLPDEINYYEM